MCISPKYPSPLKRNSKADLEWVLNRTSIGRKNTEELIWFTHVTFLSKISFDCLVASCLPISPFNINGSTRYPPLVDHTFHAAVVCIATHACDIGMIQMRYISFPFPSCLKWLNYHSDGFLQQFWSSKKSSPLADSQKPVLVLPMCHCKMLEEAFVTSTVDG